MKHFQVQALLALSRFVPTLNTTMRDNAETSCVLLVTRLEYKPPEKGTNRKASYEWGTSLFQDIIESSSKTFEGELKTVIPLRIVIRGFLYKFILSNVPDELVMQVLIPGLQQRCCTVHRVDTQLAEHDRKRAEKRLQEVKEQCQEVGDVAQMRGLLTQLAHIRGDGGSPERRQKFANDAMEVARISYRIRGATLKEGTTAAE